MNVNDMEIAKSLFNPKRVRILRLVEEEEMTVKEMAQALNEKPSRLYYHIHKLLEQGLLEAADSKQVGHLTETYYKAVSGLGAFDIDSDFGQENTDYIIKQLLMHVNKNIEALKTDLKNGNLGESHMSSASLLQADLSRKEWQKLNAEIRQLIDKRNKEAKTSKDQDKLQINYTLMSYVDEQDT
jgi:DNA-binding transcriptional ArsR family regulator